jgi:hypothetical protein
MIMTLSATKPQGNQDDYFRNYLILKNELTPTKENLSKYYHSKSPIHKQTQYKFPTKSFTILLITITLE